MSSIKLIKVNIDLSSLRQQARRQSFSFASIESLGFSLSVKILLVIYTISYILYIVGNFRVINEKSTFQR